MLITAVSVFFCHPACLFAACKCCNWLGMLVICEHAIAYFAKFCISHTSPHITPTQQHIKITHVEICCITYMSHISAYMPYISPNSAYLPRILHQKAPHFKEKPSLYISIPNGIALRLPANLV